MLLEKMKNQSEIITANRDDAMLIKGRWRARQEDLDDVFSETGQLGTLEIVRVGDYMGSEQVLCNENAEMQCR